MKTEWVFTQFILDNSNLSIEEEFWGWLFINFPKIFSYSIMNISDKKSILFHHPYYTLKNDYDRLKNTKEFKKSQWDITLWFRESDKYDSLYAENISKSNKFELSVLYKDDLLTDTDKNIIKNDKNKVILNIKDIDPKLVNFSFERNINIWNIDFNIFKITYKNKTIYFVYDLNNKKWSIIDKIKLDYFDLIKIEILYLIMKY